MFMFRSRRTNLTKRLLKARKQRTNNGGDDGTTLPSSSSFRRTSSQNNNNNNNSSASVSDDNNNNNESVTVLLRQLQENQLGMLWTAIESRGRDVSNCILLPPEQQPHVLCCRVWRWPDLVQDNELRRLPVCRSASDPVYICCNPYHWSRVFQTETPLSPLCPPPYIRDPAENLRPEDRAPSEGWNESLTTSGEESLKNPKEWCRLAYWEMAKRVGPLYPVDTPAVNILGDVPYGDGLSLQILAQQNCNAPESVIRTRCSIGLGVTLSLEGDHVWIYNRSDNPIFVKSASWDLRLPPTRVPAEQCLCIFDKAAQNTTTNNNNNNNNNDWGPICRNSIIISFVKGWGPGYARRDILSCPCWMEVLLAPYR